MNITTTTLRQWLRRSAELIQAERERLTDLDAAIGDADHGVNLNRGFVAVVEALPTMHDLDAGAMLKATGMRLIATVGGASGPLYGTAFRRMGRQLEGMNSLDAATLVGALHAFVEGVQTIGKATIGDKTMVDALSPAVATLDTAVATGALLPQAMREAAECAKASAEGTIPLLARRGRASYLGERSIGHQDPGATSAALLIQALADVVAQEAK
ncbi:MAG: dihydroxyacetone kinase subunit L [Oscillochloris sp.]|nr:dihydroxyacetone kinase subunit L [Oscillochloris sp.]